MHIYSLVTCFEAVLCPTLKNTSLTISTVLLHLQHWGNAEISVTLEEWLFKHVGCSCSVLAR